MAAHEHIDWVVLVAGLFGVLIAFSIWWIYFDTTANREVKSGIWFHNIWLYLHFLMYIGIAGMGAGVLTVVEETGEHLSDEVRWLLAGTIGVTLLAMGLLQAAFKTYQGVKPQEHQKDMILKLSAGILAFVLAFVARDIGSLAMLGLLWLLIAGITLYIVRVWLRLRREGVIPVELATD